MPRHQTMICRASLLALSLVSATASGGDWYAAATGCTPYPEAIRGATFSNANGRLRLAPNITGASYFVCNVDSSSVARNAGGQAADRLYLSITYQIDSSDRLLNVQTTADLKGVSKVTGNISNIAAAGFKPGSIPAWLPSGVVTSSSAAFRGQDLDFANNYYYVIITLSRSSAAINPIVYGVGLTENQLIINPKIESPAK